VPTSVAKLHYRGSASLISVLVVASITVPRIARAHVPLSIADGMGSCGQCKELVLAYMAIHEPDVGCGLWGVGYALLFLDPAMGSPQPYKHTYDSLNVSSTDQLAIRGYLPDYTQFNIP
jgi:hypothetical protein